MRRHYLDNLRWVTVLLVVFYHVIYMYNGVITAGVVGPFAPVQPQDAVQYLLYPWFMVLLFVVSGASARLALERQPPKAFAARRTEKLLVPSTLGLLVFQWVLGGFNMALAGAFDTLPPLPAPVLWLIMAASGCGVLWFAQMLWLFSMVLVLLRRFETGRLYRFCGRLGPLSLVTLGLPLWAAAQVLNAPYIAVYRFGIYAFAFLLGYFIFAHEAVVERLAAHPLPFCTAALALGTAYTLRWFGQNYATPPAVNSPLAIAFAWAAALAAFAAMKRWGDRTGPLAAWLGRPSFGLYVLHYLPLAAAAWAMDRFFHLPAWVCYLLAAAAAFGGGYGLNALISRTPVLRWCVLGKRKEKRHVSG